MEKCIFLKPDRERSVLQRHPWIFSGAIASTSGNPDNGETVLVRSAKGESLGLAAFNPKSNISGRMWSWNPDEPIDAHFFWKRLKRAVENRDPIHLPQSEARRLVHAESDGIPGLIVDRYADWVVVQFLTAGVEYWREAIIDALVDTTQINNIFDRSDADVRQLEGLDERVECVRGLTPKDEIIISEGGLKFYVDIVHGHKTGFYLDQRLNRQRFRSYVANQHVLNCFSYTGAFAVYALAGGAESVLSVDSSGEMLRLAQKNVVLNQQAVERVDWLEGDVFQVLRLLRDQGRSFDIIVLDPPKFAPTAMQAERAARGYKDINLLALKLLNSGGHLFTFSCSGGVSADLFQKILAGAALDAKVDAQIIEHLHQAPDHPVALNFPEGEYLKGFVLRKL